MRGSAAAGTGAERPRGGRALSVYYLATPLFMLADYAGGMSVRAAAFDGRPGLKLAYYTLCCGCAGLTLWKPRLSAWIGVVESSVNIFVLILGILLPIFSLSLLLESGVPPAAPISPGRVANFLISGGVWVAAFHHNLSLGRKTL